MFTSATCFTLYHIKFIRFTTLHINCFLSQYNILFDWNASVFWFPFSQIMSSYVIQIWQHFFTRFHWSASVGRGRAEIFRNSKSAPGGCHEAWCWPTEEQHNNLYHFSHLHIYRDISCQMKYSNRIILAKLQFGDFLANLGHLWTMVHFLHLSARNIICFISWLLHFGQKAYCISWRGKTAAGGT